jgi:hypothetical protein
MILPESQHECLMRCAPSDATRPCPPLKLAWNGSMKTLTPEAIIALLADLNACVDVAYHSLVNHSNGIVKNQDTHGYRKGRSSISHQANVLQLRHICALPLDNLQDPIRRPPKRRCRPQGYQALRQRIQQITSKSRPYHVYVFEVGRHTQCSYCALTGYIWCEVKVDLQILQRGPMC